MVSLETIIGLLVGLGMAWLVIYWIARNRKNKGYENKALAEVARTDKIELRWRSAVKYLEQHNEITNDEYQKLTGVSDAQATRDLDGLEKQGIVEVEQVGAAGHAVKYVLKNKE